MNGADGVEQIWERQNAMNKWIDVNKYKPEYNKTVLVVLDGTMINNGKHELGKNKPYDAIVTIGFLKIERGKERFVAYSNSYAACFFQDEEAALVYGMITHWMHLPKLPLCC